MTKIFIKLILISVLIPSLSFSQAYSSNITRGNDFDSSLTAGTPTCGSVINPIINCGFETGDFTGWIATDIVGPFIPLAVNLGGVDPGFNFFISAPTEGSFAATSGFDGNSSGGGARGTGALGQVIIAQDIVVPGTATDLTFDYRGAWDLTFGATIDRTFDIEIQPSGGGAALQTTTILTAPFGDTTLDTGNLSGSVDVSAYANQAVRVAFVLNVPEDSTGPAWFQLDNVAIQGSPPPMNIAPTASFTYTCNFTNCSFDASGSSDSDGTITNYSWSFGDIGVMATNRFTLTGSYDVTLTVTDNAGATDSITVGVIIEPVTVPLLSNIGTMLAFFVLLLFGFRQLKSKQQA